MIRNSSLYPDILFHFTQDKDSLFNILNDTFRISYAREKVEGIETKREFAVPMVSFCDLKLSELKVHMGKYGSYGIGLTKEWANRKGLNPVMYINSNCPFTDNFNNSLNGVYQKINNLSDGDHFKGISENNKKIFDAYRYIKNYEGTLVRGDEVTENFRFADEREWRYVPPIDKEGIPPFVAKSNIETKAKKDKYNELASELRLRFEPNDIKYLIVKSDEEINDLINHLGEAKGRFERLIRERLMSRILTAEQISRDI
ncbi:hypothetical protein F0237_09600 [Vibrio tubiashii]|uniref:Abortive phage resistance protein AbiGi, antitoxin n=1 Tax=Vibrio tubiashii TaxID=29498 RepID=A0AAE5GQ46_9VIBR|nr:abortive infection system antitoxin AbiGi family protein [Vibrio tubiashii]NOI80918.1 hypothetical protein [Vibrio tubiashii]